MPGPMGGTRTGFCRVTSRQDLRDGEEWEEDACFRPGEQPVGEELGKGRVSSTAGQGMWAGSLQTADPGRREGAGRPPPASGKPRKGSTRSSEGVSLAV